MARSERGLDRLIAFSDGVVAIAITLLVLPLTALDVRRYDGDLAALVSDNGPAFRAFLLSFLVIGVFWMAHHRVLENLVDYDGALVRWNLFWLLVIVFLPFPTYLLGFGDSRSYALLYIGTMTLSAVGLKAISWHLDRHPELRRSGLDPVALAVGRNRSTLSIVLFLLAFTIAVVVPEAGLYALLVLVLLGPLARLLARRTTPAPNAEAPTTGGA